MPKYAFVDIESRSSCDLATYGLYRYLADPSTAPVSIVALADDIAHVWVNAAWTPGVSTMPKGKHDSTLDVRVTYSVEIPKWFRSLAKSHTFVGHNATDFDDPFLQRLGVNAKWIDTLPIARQAGLPGALDAIGKMLTGAGKHEGKAVLPKFFDTKHKYPYYLLWALVNYNIADCELTRTLFEYLAPYFADAETELLAVHNTINRRGVRADETLRAAIANISIEAQNRAYEEIEALTKGALTSTSLRSVPKMKAWLDSMGFTVPNTRRETLNQLLADPDAFFTEGPGLDLESVMPIVPKVLRLRSAATRTTGGKIARIESRTDADGRLRGMFVYHGAHTGRFTSRAVQLHNMHRGIDKCDVPALLAKPLTYDRLAAEAQRLRELGVGWIGVDDILATLLRYVFLPTEGKLFSVIDYSAIEARGAAWIAGEEKLLDAYRNNRDVYCEFGSMLFGRTITKADKIERQISKVVVLGSQYGLGHKKLGYYVAAQGVDLATAGVTAYQCTEAYRNAYPAIAGFKQGEYRSGGIWHKLNAAVRSVVADGATLSVGKCVLGMYGPHLIIQLPSTRELTYRNARIENVVPSWGGEPMPSVTYDGQFGYRKNLYGGLICENVVQAICRDLLCEAMIRMEKVADVVLHVHDEIVCEIDTPKEHEKLMRLMSEVPTWASGFPISVEGHCSKRYGKQPVR